MRTNSTEKNGPSRTVGNYNRIGCLLCLAIPLALLGLAWWTTTPSKDDEMRDLLSQTMQARHDLGEHKPETIRPSSLTVTQLRQRMEAVAAGRGHVADEAGRVVDHLERLPQATVDGTEAKARWMRDMDAALARLETQIAVELR